MNLSYSCSTKLEPQSGGVTVSWLNYFCLRRETKENSGTSVSTIKIKALRLVLFIYCDSWITLQQTQITSMLLRIPRYTKCHFWFFVAAYVPKLKKLTWRTVHFYGFNSYKYRRNLQSTKTWNTSRERSMDQSVIKLKLAQSSSTSFWEHFG